jgi:acyl dehydratase
MSCISGSTCELMIEAELLHFEDFRAGQIFRLGRHTLTAEEMIEFACEFDPQPQHTDPEAAKHSMLGGLAASGWHLGALAMRMMVDGLFNRATSMGSPGIDEIQWRKPVLVGERIRLDGEVLDTRPSSRPDRGFVRFRFTMVRDEERRSGEMVMVFVCSVMFRRRSG